MKPKKSYKERLITVLSFLFLASLIGIGRYLNHPQVTPQKPRQAYTPIVGVKLVGKTNEGGANGQQFMKLDISYANQSGQDIAGVSGLLLIADSNDTPLLPLQVEFNESIPAFKTVVQQGYTAPRMPGMAENQKLWDTDFAHLHTTFTVNEVRFREGGKLDFRYEKTK